MTPEAIKSFLDLGGSALILITLAYIAKLFWAKIEEKDKQISEERSKREELIREYVGSTRATTEIIERAVEVIRRIEDKIDKIEKDHV